jgi:hypothetical protein
MKTVPKKGPNPSHQTSAPHIARHSQFQQAANQGKARRRGLFDYLDLQAIEEMERRSSAGSGVSGLAPQDVTRNVQILNRRDSTFTRHQGIQEAHMIYDQCRDAIRIAGGAFNVSTPA